MWTLKQFETIYDRYQSSGLRLKDFCQNECILESKFYYWQRRLREHNVQSERFDTLLALFVSNGHAIIQMFGLSHGVIQAEHGVNRFHSVN